MIRQSYVLKYDPETRVDLTLSDDARLRRKVYIDLQSGETKEIKFDVLPVKAEFNLNECKKGTEQFAKLMAAREMLSRTLLLTPLELNSN